MKRIAILAGTHAEFRSFLMDHVNKETTYHFVDSIENIRGCWFDQYMVWGTFWKRHDANRLYNAVADLVLRDKKPFKDPRGRAHLVHQVVYDYLLREWACRKCSKKFTPLVDE